MASENVTSDGAVADELPRSPLKVIDIPVFSPSRPKRPQLAERLDSWRPSPLSSEDIENKLRSASEKREALKKAKSPSSDKLIRALQSRESARENLLLSSHKLQDRIQRASLNVQEAHEQIVNKSKAHNEHVKEVACKVKTEVLSYIDKIKSQSAEKMETHVQRHENFVDEQRRRAHKEIENVAKVLSSQQSEELKRAEDFRKRLSDGCARRDVIVQQHAQNASDADRKRAERIQRLQDNAEQQRSLLDRRMKVAEDVRAQHIQESVRKANDTSNRVSAAMEKAKVDQQNKRSALEDKLQSASERRQAYLANRSSPMKSRTSPTPATCSPNGENPSDAQVSIFDT